MRDTLRHIFRAAAEVHATQLVQLRLQVVDLALTGVQFCLEDEYSPILFSPALFKEGDIVGENIVHGGHATRLSAG